jgi:hypothetical protein
MFYMPRDGFRRLIPIASRVAHARRGLHAAADRGEMFHLWFHPFNLGSDMHLFDGLERIFQFVNGLRDDGMLEVLTMHQTSERIMKFSEPAVCSRS